jgi:hypothetical protein
MPDAEPTPEHLEQLARSLAMSPSLTDADRHAVIDALRAAARRARRDLSGRRHARDTAVADLSGHTAVTES